MPNSLVIVMLAMGVVFLASGIFVALSGYITRLGAKSITKARQPILWLPVTCAYGAVGVFTIWRSDHDRSPLAAFFCGVCMLAVAVSSIVCGETGVPFGIERITKAESPVSWGLTVLILVGGGLAVRAACVFGLFDQVVTVNSR